MNDLLRPALYDAWHPVDAGASARRRRLERWEIVGPVCESADFLAHDRALALAEGDLLAIGAAGAYAMAMSSNYNSRPRACEVHRRRRRGASRASPGDASTRCSQANRCCASGDVQRHFRLDAAAILLPFMPISRSARRAVRSERDELRARFPVAKSITATCETGVRIRNTRAPRAEIRRPESCKSLKLV